MVTYRGLPGPVIADHLTREASLPLHAGGTSFQIGRIEMVGNTGTYIDDTDDRTRPVHSILLRAGIPIVEHLCNLEALPTSGFRFYAVPVKVKGMGTFPVRAFAEVA